MVDHVNDKVSEALAAITHFGYTVGQWHLLNIIPWTRHSVCLATLKFALQTSDSACINQQYY